VSGVALALGVLLAVSACARPAEPEVPEVRTPSATGPDGATAADPASPAPTAGVPELCEDLLTFGRLVQILQVPLDGGTGRVFNDDYLSDSGRTGRLTCTYGVPTDLDEPATPGQPAAPAPVPPTPVPPPVEISVSGYTEADVAGARVEATVAGAQGSGTQIEAQAIGGRDGFVLNDPEDVSFVVADGARTYVVTLRHGVVPAAAERVVLLGLAGELLGEPVPTPTASP
jgi:hypothetical protein